MRTREHREVACDEPGDALSPRRVRLATRMAFAAGEAARLRGALAVLIAAEVIDPVSGPAPKLLERASAGGFELRRDEALDCCAGLLEAADAAFRKGEFVGGYALLGISDRLLEELIGDGRTPADWRST